MHNSLRLLPAVDELLQSPAAKAASQLPREAIARIAKHTLAAWRGRIQAAGWSAGEVGDRLQRGELAGEFAQALTRERGRGLRPALNATGVVLHTGLGRAPLHPEAAAAMERAARSYVVLEVDRYSGERNQRDQRIGELLARLTGAESGIAVNNNAGAVMLALSAFAFGKQTIVSRGELVEIGGAFRMPDVMARAGTQLREVGTTNRTRIADYSAALGPNTGLLLKVHSSNFRQVGFVEEVEPRELVALSKASGVPAVFDLGSGLLEAAGAEPLDMLGAEPLVRAAVASGLDIVTFSGDKLLGATQAGLIVGKQAAVESMRRDPLYRALRLDKVTIAGLERSLELLLEGRGDELPTRRMLRLQASEIEPRARALALAIGALPELQAQALPERSQPGSGSAPDVFLDTFAVRVTHARLAPEKLAAALRAGEPPLFARVHEGALLLDPRSLLPGEDELVLECLRRLASN